MIVLSLDIGGTHLRIGAIDQGGTVLKCEKLPTASVIHSGNVLSDLSAFVRSFSAGLSVDAIAIGFPATLDRSRRVVVQAPNIPFMENLPVCDDLQKEFSVPVFAERDVTFSLLYDVEKYRLPKEGMICGIYFGTGIGNAILLDGKPLTGRHGTAGELGHIPVPGCGIPCGCGNAGCMEAFAGGKALVRLQKERYPDTPVGEIFTRHRRDQHLLDVIDGMAVSVATEVNILDPDYILLGGGVLNMSDFPRSVLEEQIIKHVRKPLPCRELNLIFTEDEPEKSVLGGAVYARRNLEDGSDPLESNVAASFPSFINGL